jgi:hypothetical protein
MTRQDTQAELLASRITQLTRQYSEKTEEGAEASEEIQSISAACTELNALISTPESWVECIALSYSSSAAICILLDLNVFYLLSQNNESASLDTLVRFSGCSRALLSITTCFVSFEPSVLIL